MLLYHLSEAVAAPLSLPRRSEAKARRGDSPKHGDRAPWLQRDPVFQQSPNRRNESSRMKKIVCDFSEMLAGSLGRFKVLPHAFVLMGNHDHWACEDVVEHDGWKHERRRVRNVV